MQVSLVTETFAPDINGVAATLDQLVAGLADAGHGVQVIHPENGDDAPPGALVERVIVPGFRLPWYPQVHLGLPVMRRLARAWDDCPPDVVHIATEGPLGWAALRMARRRGLPVTSSLHTNFHAYARHYGLSWFERPAMAYLRDFHGRTGLTLIPTRQQKSRLEAQGFADLTVLGRGVDASLFHPGRRSPDLRRAWGAAEDDIVVCCVSRLAPEKNLDLFARTVRAMQAVNPRVHGVLVGDGPERARLEREYPGLVFCGARRGEDLARHYASADVFLFPSLTETFGIVLLEAMAAGLAVVAFDYAAGAELVEDGVSGRLAPFEDEAAFLRLAESLARDPASIPGLGQAATRAASGHSWQSVRQRFTELLETAVDAAGG